MPKASPSTGRKDKGIHLRIPIFASLLLANLTLLVISIGCLVFLSVREFRADKENYVVDFASQVATGVADQTSATLDAERQKLQLLTTVLDAPGGMDAEREQLVKLMFVEFPEVIRLEVLRNGVPPIRVYNRGRLQKLGFATPEEFEAKRKAPRPPSVVEGSGIAPAVSVFTQVLSSDLVVLSVSFRFADGTGTAQASRSVVGDIVSTALTDPFVHPRGAAELLLLDPNGRVLLSGDMKQVESAVDLSNSDLVRAALRTRSPGSRSYRDTDGRALLGAYAPVPAAQLVVVTQIPAAKAYAAGNRLVQKSLVTAAMLILLMSVFAVVVARRFSAPLVRMARATEQIAAGDFRVSVPVSGSNEISDLGSSLNRMSAELLARDARLEEAQVALVASEKMAAFGTLGAGIAHEVKNPLAGILGVVDLWMNKLPAEDPGMRYLKMIDKEARRCTDIVGNLLKFARREKAEFKPTDLNEVVADTYKLVNHQLGLKRVQVDLDMASDLPMVKGNANQLQQVLLNLAINAGDAMPDGGKVTFSTTSRSGRGARREVEVRVTDNGTGIPPAVKAKIFDPFFTTKEPGKGTGLGLSVSFGIITEHQGRFEVDSEIGKGTSFKILLPVIGTEPSQADVDAAVSTAAEARR